MKITEVRAIPLSIPVEGDDYRARIGAHSTVSIIVVEITTDNGLRGYGEGLARHAPKAHAELIDHVLARHYIGQNPFEAARLQIGRASCRERVCQYVEISVVAGSLKKKTTAN